MVLVNHWGDRRMQMHAFRRSVRLSSCHIEKPRPFCRSKIRRVSKSRLAAPRAGEPATLLRNLEIRRRHGSHLPAHPELRPRIEWYAIGTTADLVLNSARGGLLTTSFECRREVAAETGRARKVLRASVTVQRASMAARHSGKMAI